MRSDLWPIRCAARTATLDTDAAVQQRPRGGRKHSNHVCCRPSRPRLIDTAIPAKTNVLLAEARAVSAPGTIPSVVRAERADRVRPVKNGVSLRPDLSACVFPSERHSF
jgi:hypothetical protein